MCSHYPKEDVMLNEFIGLLYDRKSFVTLKYPPLPNRVTIRAEAGEKSGQSKMQKPKTNPQNPAIWKPKEMNATHRKEITQQNILLMSADTKSILHL
jgi:hypothetical protein